MALFEAIIAETLKNSNANTSNFEKNVKLSLSSKVVKYYRVNKSKLKKELLVFLANKNVEKGLKFIILEKINTGVYLAENGYGLEGLKVIEEAKEQAIKEELFQEVLFALNKIRSYKLELRRKTDLSFAFIEEYKLYQKIQNNLSDYVNLSFYIYSFHNDLGADIKILEALRNHELLQEESTALSVTAKKFYYLGRLDILNSSKEYEKMLEITLEAIKFGKVAYNKNENFANILIALYERLQYVAIRLKKYELGLDISEKWKILSYQKLLRIVYSFIN